MGLLRVRLFVAWICLVWIKGPIMGIDFRLNLSVNLFGDNWMGSLGGLIYRL
jgi:hypothetical protein